MGLAITLITGLRDAPKQRVVDALGFSGSGTYIESETDEDFALVLAGSLVDLAEDGARGRTGILIPAEADPVELALVLPRVFADRGGDVALDTVAAVASAADIRELLFGDGDTDEGVELALSETLALQLEFSTMIILTDLHECGSSQLAEIRGLLFKLNPRARQVELTAENTLRALTPATRPNANALGRTVGWMQELSGIPLPLSVCGISSVVYRDPRPFHPTRLAHAVDGWLEPGDVGLIARSRGLVRLASRIGRVGSWSIAGNVLSLDPTAMLSGEVDTPLGQELVFFGRGLNREYLFRVLDSCLLTAKELVAGPVEWETYADPFPAWNLEHDH